MSLWRRARRRAAAGDDLAAPAAIDGMVVDLADLVERRCEVWWPRFRARGIELEAAVGPACVVGAADELAIALDALLSNAMRFSDHGDHVSVSVRARQSDVLLQVADTGVGILAEEVGRVFNRFFRGSLARERTLGGSGLGLTIAKEFIEAHGGDIRCASVAGEGSCFSVFLPPAPSDAVAGSAGA
jgi:signal transduction histidine kinase